MEHCDKEKSPDHALVCNTCRTGAGTDKTNDSASSRHAAEAITEEQLEASMRASDDELRQVTSAIRYSFHQASARPEGAVAHGSRHMSPAAANVSSHSSGVMEQLMEEMDQVFHDVLQGEDELRIVACSMTSASETSSCVGERVDASHVSADSCVLSLSRRPLCAKNEDDNCTRPDLFMYNSKESLPLMGRQRTNAEPCVPVESVPLAEMDDFSESLCMSSDESTRRCSQTDSNSYLTNQDVDSFGKDVATGDEADISSLVMASGCAKVTKRKRKSKTRGGKTVRSDQPSSAEQQALDDRGSVSSMYKWWFNQIEEQDKLEQNFFSSQNDKSYKDADYSMLEFAERYYNTHYIIFGYSSALTKTVNIVRRKSFSEVVPLEDMLKWPKSSSIPTSHVHLLEAEDVLQACSIFKDLYRYVKGEVKGDTGVSLIRSVLAKGKDRVELRDEIYCQLLRLSNANPSLDNTLRAWAVMSVCSVAFAPSHTLLKYFISYLRQHCDDNEEFPVSAKVSPYAQYCLQHITSHQQKQRKRVPSLVEIQAILMLQPLVYRIYFLDGTTKAIACDPLQSAQDALHIIKDKMGLKNMEGWALYENTPTRERYVKHTEYLADILSQWEQKQHKDQSLPTSPKKLSSGSPKLHAQNYGKLIMCKRLFQRITDVPSDPIELHLLYSQAVHSVVQLDEYMVPPHIALHLAGLQAQVEYDDYEEDKLYRYQEEETFLCERILCSESRDWRRDISEAHQRYGKGKSVAEAQYKYLTIVSQFQLYGCTKIFAHYSGVWSYGTESILAIGYEGIQCISIEKKMLLFDYCYTDIEKIMLDELYDVSYIILLISDSVSQSQQKCFIFECLNLEDFVSLIEFYSPEHAIWTQSSEHWRKVKFQIHHDWLKVYEDTLACRRMLMENDITKKPTTNTGGLLKTALHRISSRNCGTGRHSDENDDVALSSFWSFSRSPMKSALTKCTSHEMEDVAVRMFNSTLVYTGFESTALLEDTDLVVVVQTLITKCMENKELCNEFFLQLIKQTTDTQSELNQKGIHRCWHLMTIALCVMLPSSQIVFNYLNLHLRRYAMQENTEEGKYAHFCIKSLYRTYQNKGRKYPPSYREIHFVTQRQPIEAHVYISDGHVHFIEFDSSTTAREILPIIKAKTGMRIDSEGYAVYQISGDREIYIKPDEKLADAMYNWERMSRLDAPGTKNMVLMFKKRLFIEPFVNLNDPVEVDLLYNQSVTDVFDQKIPLTKSDATYLCALRAQFEYGDFRENSCYDYHAVMRILPRHLRDLLLISDIILLHKSFAGTSCVQINIAFIEILKQWPLYGSTMFKVTTNLENLPKVVWFVVSPMGIHLMEVKGPNIYYTYTFEEVTSCSPTNKNLTIVINKDSQQQELFFYTNEAEQIVCLIKDYSECAPHLSLTEGDDMSPSVADDQDNVSIESVTLDISS